MPHICGGGVDRPLVLFCHPRLEVPINNFSLENSDLNCGSVIYVEYASGTFDPILIYEQHSESVSEKVNFPIMLLLMYVG